MGIGEIAVACGIPSAVFAALLGFVIRRFEKRLDASRKEQEEREKEREQFEQYQISTLMANTKLCEAIATAMQNGKCNGETHAALEYVQKVKREQKDFLIKQGIKNLF